MTARPVVLWRQPDILTLWGIPHDMRPGQSPADLFAAQPFPRPGWYGAAGRAAGPREGWRIISAGEAGEPESFEDESGETRIAARELLEGLAKLGI